MWKLVRSSLAYHRRAALWTLVIAALFPNLGLVVAAIVGVALVSAEDKEGRLLQQLPLPVTRTQIAWARVVFPAELVVMAAAVAGVFASMGYLFIEFDSRTGLTVQKLLLLTVGVLFFMELLLTIGELRVWERGRLDRTLVGGAVVVTLLGAASLKWIVLAISASDGVVTLGTATMSPGLMALTVFLFLRRPSFVSG